MRAVLAAQIMEAKRPRSQSPPRSVRVPRGSVRAAWTAQEAKRSALWRKVVKANVAYTAFQCTVCGTQFAKTAQDVNDDEAWRSFSDHLWSHKEAKEKLEELLALEHLVESKGERSATSSAKRPVERSPTSSASSSEAAKELSVKETQPAADSEGDDMLGTWGHMKCAGEHCSYLAHSTLSGPGMPFGGWCCKKCEYRHRTGTVNKRQGQKHGPKCEGRPWLQGDTAPPEPPLEPCAYD